jgi:hypothetical protein
MGLDMYLERKIFVGGRWGADFQITVVHDGENVEVNPEKVMYICEEFACWRKVNAIHNWFVENVQEGVDNCANYEVSLGDLKSLLGTVEEVLEYPKKAVKLLPTTTGFFFGNTEYGEWYFHSFKYTRKVLKEAIEILEDDLEKERFRNSFEYSSSW